MSSADRPTFERITAVGEMSDGEVTVIEGISNE